MHLRSSGHGRSAMYAVSNSVPRTAAIALGVCTWKSGTAPSAVATTERRCPAHSAIDALTRVVAAIEYSSIVYELDSDKTSLLPSRSVTVSFDFAVVRNLSRTLICIIGAA